MKQDYEDFEKWEGPSTPPTNPLRSEFKTYQAQALHDYLGATKDTPPAEFYRDVFPLGSLADANAQENGKYACRLYRQENYSQYVNDDLKSVLACTSNDTAVMSFVSYAGRGESKDKARELYALMLKVNLPEEISCKYVYHALWQLEYVTSTMGYDFPRSPRILPTYILTDDSYETLYFCYVLWAPLPMYHHLHKRIQRLYDALSRAIHKIWDIVMWDDMQQRFIYKYECQKPLPDSIFQRYPVVGTKCGTGTLKAYKTGKRYHLEELNALVPKASQVELYNPQMSLEEAKEKYPDWYTRRIVQHRKTSKSQTFQNKPALYQWFLKKVLENPPEIKPGAMEALASYAAKCGISEHSFNEDLKALHGVLAFRFPDAIVAEHEQTARELFDDDPLSLKYWRTDVISECSGIPIEPNKRNYRTQKEHLKLVHESQSRKDEIVSWHKAHPGGTQTQCSTELGISRKTVSKWWPAKKKPEKVKNPCPVCGAPMVKNKIEPYFWALKSKFYSRIDKDCPNCHNHINGKPYVCQRPV